MLMLWSVIARFLFILAVGYAAYQLQPLGDEPVESLGFGVGLGALVIFLEQRLKHIAMTHMLGSLLGGAVGLGAAKTIGAALYWADVNDRRVVFLHSLILLGLPYIGLVMGARNAEWLEPERIVGLFRNTGPRRRYRVLDTSVIIDGRIDRKSTCLKSSHLANA